MYMCRHDKYIMRPIIWHGERWWLIKANGKPKDYHTHVKYEYKNAAKMICVRAEQGIIPESYPAWMVHSINRLWFGKDFDKRGDLNNTDLLTNKEEVRIKRRTKKKKYNNNPCKGRRR